MATQVKSINNKKKENECVVALGSRRTGAICSCCYRYYYLVERETWEKIISEGCCGDSWESITSKPQQTPCGQYNVNIPGVSVGWDKDFRQASCSSAPS